MATYSSVNAAPQRGGSGAGLFTNQIVKFVILGLGCLFSVVIGVQITAENTNGLALFMRYVAFGSFLLALVSPRAGIYVVLFSCPVLDLIKRFLILFDSLSMIDVASVLAFAPVTMAGAVAGLLFKRFVFRQRASMQGERTLFLILIAITTLIVTSTFLHAEESKLMVLRNLGEGSVYLGLILLVPVFFPTTEDIATLMRWCVVAFVPVALYGLWQKAFGLSDFEWRYLMSGLTITTDDFASSERVFSTLNSNHSFSVSMACCAVISLLQRSLPATGRWQRLVQTNGRWIFLIFSAATVISLRRTGWLVVMFSLAGAYCFRSRFRTTVFYVLCLTGGIFVLFNTEYIFGQLPQWESNIQRAIPGYDQAFTLQTFNDRLLSFQTLRESSSIWTAFGMPTDMRGTVYVHDAITQTLVSYGVVGMLAFMVLLGQTLAVSHRLVWKAPNGPERSYAAMLLAFIFANLFVGAIMQSHIEIFPVNFIFWMCAGALLKITVHQQPILVEDKPKPIVIKVDLEAEARARINLIGRSPVVNP